MTQELSKEAGKALSWKSIQHFGVKLIYLVRLLVLARLLSPDDFGLVAIASTGVGFFLSITNFGILPALIQGEDLDESHYHVGWTIRVTRALVISLIIMIGAPYIAAIFAEPRAVMLLRILALRPIFEALSSIKIVNLNKALNFRPLAVLGLAEALSNSIISIGFAQVLGVWALVLGTLAGAAVYLIVSYIQAPYRPKLNFDSPAAKRLVKFGRWIFLTGLIGIAGNQILRVMISRNLGAAELGLYFLATQLAFLFSEVASQVIGEVSFPLYARLQSNSQAVTRTFRKFLLGISAAFLPLYGLLIILAPNIVHGLLGEKWLGTEMLISLLSIVGILGLLGDVAVPLFNGLGFPRIFANIEIAQSVLLVGTAWYFTEKFGLLGAGLAWFPAILGTFFVSFYYLNKLLHKPFSGLMRPFAAVILATAMGMVIAYQLKDLYAGIAGLIFSGSLSGILMIAFLLTLDRIMRLGLLEAILNFFPQLAGVIKLSVPNKRETGQ